MHAASERSGNLSLQAAMRLNKLSAVTPAVLGPSSPYILQGCMWCVTELSQVSTRAARIYRMWKEGAVDRQGNRVGEGREMKWVFIGVTAGPGGGTAVWQWWHRNSSKYAATVYPAAGACLSAVFTVFWRALADLCRQKNIVSGLHTRRPLATVPNTGRTSPLS